MLKELFDLLIDNRVEYKVAKRVSNKVTSKDDCWLWQANKDIGGYGRFQYQSKNCYAHRWIFQQLKGYTRETIDHICSQRACVNPIHLQEVTRGENTKLMFQRGPKPRPNFKNPASRLFKNRHAIENNQLCNLVFTILLENKVDKEDALRFSTKIEINENDCWIWNGRKNEDGYSCFSFLPSQSKKHKLTSGHRWAYQKLIGDPGNLVLDHLCRNRACCNPTHLDPVTRIENTKRADFKTRSLKITHCPKGHEYNEENTRITIKGARSCRICERNLANSRNTHCKEGHEYTIENTGYRILSNEKKVRFCKICTSQPRIRATSCYKGHPYNEKNTYINKNGERICRVCARTRANNRKKHCSKGHLYTKETIQIINGARTCLICNEKGPRYTKTHCSQGHAFTKENTGYRPRRSGNPYRYCIICDRKKAREYQHKKRLERKKMLENL